METVRRQLCALLAVCCTMFPGAAFAGSMQPQDYRVPAEIAGDACRVTDPSDPHQILGPNPAHADCLTALYPAAAPVATFATDGLGPGAETAALTTSPLSQTVTLWLSIAALFMLVLAGFNSRKRHRQLPMPGHGGTGTFSQTRESLHSHTEGSRWHED